MTVTVMVDAEWKLNSYTRKSWFARVSYKSKNVYVSLHFSHQKQRSTLSLTSVDYNSVCNVYYIDYPSLRWGGGGAKGSPCGFSQIAPEVLGSSLWNLPYLSGQLFHTLWQTIRYQVIIGQPWVTSEWRHVPPILTNKKSWQETPPRAQFLSYDQLSYLIWRIICRVTKRLSRIFKIVKISKNFENKYQKFQTIS